MNLSFENFKKNVQIAFKNKENCFEFGNSKARNGTARDTNIDQHVIDYSIKKITSLSDEESLKSLEMLVENFIAPCFNRQYNDKNFKNTIRYNKSLHNNLLKKGKNTLDTKSIIEINIGKNVIYVLPYSQDIYNVIDNEQLDCIFRIATILISK